MAKYSVGGVEVIRDDGTIDFGRFTGLQVGVRDVKIGSADNCASLRGTPPLQMRGQFSRTRVNNSVTFNFYLVDNSPSNCNCNCAAPVNCDCS